MAVQLRNTNMELNIDLPHENYRLARFDWTGKITRVKFKGKLVSGTEVDGQETDAPYGQGFYNEFGIDLPVGFAEAEPGEWFHKIGVGLLRKDDQPYDFAKAYEIKPATFEVIEGSDQLQLICQGPSHNGYAYTLEKEIRLLESGFQINYRFTNTGENTILTNEYNHNFLAIQRAQIGREYVLKLPFQIEPSLFGETVNPEGAVVIGARKITFQENPQEPFFFSNLSGDEGVEASWQLENRSQKLGIVESGSFRTESVNLWGCGHVISPELFIELLVESEQTLEWSRTYTVYELE